MDIKMTIKKSWIVTSEVAKASCALTGATALNIGTAVTREIDLVLNSVKNVKGNIRDRVIELETSTYGYSWEEYMRESEQETPETA